MSNVPILSSLKILYECLSEMSRNNEEAAPRHLFTSYVERPEDDPRAWMTKGVLLYDFPMLKELPLMIPFLSKLLSSLAAASGRTSPIREIASWKNS